VKSSKTKNEKIQVMMRLTNAHEKKKNHENVKHWHDRACQGLHKLQSIFKNYAISQ
jgi:hypothetical protein